MRDISYAFISIAIMAAITFVTRMFPFLFFRKQSPPPAVLFVQKYIPPMVMTILVIYCLSDIRWFAPPYGIPEVLGIATAGVLHLVWRNALVSIFGSTALYMVLMQTHAIQRLLSLFFGA